MNCMGILENIALFCLGLKPTFYTKLIKMNIIHRQDNPMLIKTINELETGDLSDDGNAFLKNFIAFILERLSLINNNRYTYSMNGLINS
jgi:hypothetical protein